MSEHSFLFKILDKRKHSRNHKVGVTPDTVARAVLFIISEIQNVGMNEIAVISMTQAQ